MTAQLLGFDASRTPSLASRTTLIVLLGSLLGACSSDEGTPQGQAGAGGSPTASGGTGGVSGAPGGGTTGGGMAGSAPTAGTSATAGTSSGGGASGGTAGAAAGSGGSPVGGGGSPSGGSAGTSQGGSAGDSGGTAGAPGGGGQGGAPAGAGGGGGMPSGGGPGNLLFFDDFEGQATGAPDPSKWEVLTDSGSGTVEVTTADKHSGNQSVKVVGGSNYSDHAFLINKTVFPLASDALYLRAWVKYESANWMNHITFIKAVGAGGNEVRLGGQAGYYHANLSEGDGLTPNPFVMPCPLCVAPKANEWICIEGMFAPNDNRVQAWVNGMLAVDADSGSDWHSGSGMLPTMLDRIGFGWESYGAIGNTIYFDDIALDDERIGCD